MNIECKSFQGNGYLMSPSVDALHKLHFNEMGCTHFLLFSYAVNRDLVITQENLPALLASADNLRDGEKLYIKSMDASVQCIGRHLYLSNGSAIQLDAKASRYTILGAAYNPDTDTMCVYFPNNIETVNFAVCVEMKYQIRRHTVETGSIFGIKLTGKAGHVFKPKQNETDFCEVFIDRANDYVDGSITYTIGDNPCVYPVTKVMLGRWFLIKSPLGQKIPEFTACDSITLIKVESRV